MKENYMFFKVIRILALLPMVVTLAASAEEYTPEKFQTWSNIFVETAQKKGISQATLDKFIKNVTFLPNVVKLDRRQPFKTKTFEQYLQTVVPDSRIKKARERYKENKVLLDKTSKQYGVQPRFIVALWGVESDFGRNMGNINTPDALATLAFEGRRGEFFTKELIHALKIIDQGHIDYDKMKGSWAGAIGQTQFMPSSFVELAVDNNNDGKKDIWGTKEDIFASIANYLSKRGWNDNITWGRRVKLPKNFNTSFIDNTIEKTVKEWQTLGVMKYDGGKLPVKDGLVASIIKPEDEKDASYMVYQNYKTILKWNRSLYFATAVGILSDEIIN